jgi:hypothetical protein
MFSTIFATCLSCLVDYIDLIKSRISMPFLDCNLQKMPCPNVFELIIVP